MVTTSSHGREKHLTARTPSGKHMLGMSDVLKVATLTRNRKGKQQQEPYEVPGVMIQANSTDKGKGGGLSAAVLSPGQQVLGQGQGQGITRFKPQTDPNAPRVPGRPSLIKRQHSPRGSNGKNAVMQSMDEGDETSVDSNLAALLATAEAYTPGAVPRAALMPTSTRGLLQDQPEYGNVPNGQMQQAPGMLDDEHEYGATPLFNNKPGQGQAGGMVLEDEHEYGATPLFNNQIGLQEGLDDEDEYGWANGEIQRAASNHDHDEFVLATPHTTAAQNILLAAGRANDRQRASKSATSSVSRSVSTKSSDYVDDFPTAEFLGRRGGSLPSDLGDELGQGMPFLHDEAECVSIVHSLCMW